VATHFNILLQNIAPKEKFIMSLYHVESLLTKVAPHHASIKALWEGKWRKPVSLEKLLSEVLLILK
jgi:hypothetical protein